MSSKISTHSVVEYLKVRNSVVSNIEKPVNSDHLNALLEQTDRLFMSRVSEALAPSEPVKPPAEHHSEHVEQHKPAEHHSEHVEQHKPAEHTIKHLVEHHSEHVEQHKPAEHHSEHAEHPADQLAELAAICTHQTVEQTKHEVTDQLVTFAEDLVQHLTCHLADVLPTH